MFFFAWPCTREPSAGHHPPQDSEDILVRFKFDDSSLDFEEKIEAVTRHWFQGNYLTYSGEDRLNDRMEKARERGSIPKPFWSSEPRTYIAMSRLLEIEILERTPVQITPDD